MTASWSSGAGRTFSWTRSRTARGRSDGSRSATTPRGHRGRGSLPPQHRRVGYVPQDAGLFPHLSVRENVLFGARGATKEVAHAIEALEIGPLGGRYPASLSGGEKQRVALARALVTRPRLLLLDEPLAALDVSLRERIVPYLLRIRDEWGTPMLYVTHNVGEARALAGEVLLLDGGTVEAQGAPLALIATPALAKRAGIENLFGVS